MSAQLALAEARSKAQPAMPPAVLNMQQQVQGAAMLTSMSFSRLAQAGSGVDPSFLSGAAIAAGAAAGATVALSSQLNFLNSVPATPEPRQALPCPLTPPVPPVPSAENSVVDAEEPPEADTADTVDKFKREVDRLSEAELKELCERRGLRLTGKEDTLRERLCKQIAAEYQQRRRQDACASKAKAAARCRGPSEQSASSSRTPRTRTGATSQSESLREQLSRANMTELRKFVKDTKLEVRTGGPGRTTEAVRADVFRLLGELPSLL
eukprot:TRINITY_DN70674_c0_g1_i1.p1 TRINITY_DN70674_c0_g1~~TRINITY_DN70674_c0_g1_i1.p1  ORF type:complete len:267 (-),score=52.53 TRINITY_DN70674_c0_g1_i1:29-829(-)